MKNAPVIHSYESLNAKACTIADVDRSGISVQHVLGCKGDCIAYQNALKLAEANVPQREAK